MAHGKAAIPTDFITAHTCLLVRLESMVLDSQAEQKGPSRQAKTHRRRIKHSPKSRRAARVLMIFSLLLLGLGAARAQSTAGSIRGTVQDGTGALIPQSQIVLHSVDENTDRTIAADDSGEFLLDNIKPGRFILRAHHDGFADSNLTGIVLEPRQDLRLVVQLSVAQQSTTVEVSSAADQINTEDAVLGDLKSNEEITQLPLNNRATTTSPLGGLAVSSNVQSDSQGNIALGGASSSMISYSVDGISTANVRSNGALQDAYPSQEGISGVKVAASNNNAEFSQSGDITFTTKSGTNSYHGSLFEYLQNNALDATPYGFSSKNPKHFNTFGGSLGGPVTVPHIYSGKDRTFFFLDYEANRRSTAIAEQYLVPTEAERDADPAALAALGITQPITVSPTAKALLEIGRAHV